MIKKTIKYVDFDGTEREEDFWFNLTEAELTEMNLSKREGFQDWVQMAITAKSGKDVMYAMKKMILTSYGLRDGNRFMKSDEISAGFAGTQAYSELFKELVTDANAAAEFARNLVHVPDPEKRKQLDAEIDKAFEVQRGKTPVEEDPRERARQMMQGHLPAKE